MTDLTELQSADAYCRRLASRHYENFSVVSFFLPGDIRRDLSRIYAFCRTTDELGDESGLLSRTSQRLGFSHAGFSVAVGPPQSAQGDDSALRRLNNWYEQTTELWSSSPAPIHPVLIALSRTVDDRAMPEQPFLDLIQANVQDQSVSRYANWDDLYRYCMLSAAPVGRMVLRVFGIDDSHAQSLSDDVCIGLQLANHAQDVKRDAKKGRSYLLQTDLSAGGTQLAISHLCDEAERLLTSGERLERMVPARLAIQLSLYRLGGLEVVKRVRALNYATDRIRPSVPPLTKLILLPKALLETVSRLDHATPQRAA